MFPRRINTCPRGDFVAPSLSVLLLLQRLRDSRQQHYPHRATTAASPVSLSADIDAVHTGLLARANSFHCGSSLVAGASVPSFVPSLTDQCGWNALSQGICN